VVNWDKHLEKTLAGPTVDQWVVDSADWLEQESVVQMVAQTVAEWVVCLVATTDEWTVLSKAYR
jgi:hypothetical protein